MMPNTLTPYWHAAIEAERTLREHGCACCTIKSYSGKCDYNDGNVDIIVEGNLWTLYRSVFAGSWLVQPRDLAKYRLYEQNKLMLTATHRHIAKLHLHSNVGWHNICFIPASEVLKASVRLPVNNEQLTLLPHSAEAFITLLHVVFERFEKSKQDHAFLNAHDYKCFSDRLGLATEDVESLNTSLGPLPFTTLYRIWIRYYRSLESKGKLSWWNKFLHGGLFLKHLVRQ